MTIIQLQRAHKLNAHLKALFSICHHICKKGKENINTMDDNKTHTKTKNKLKMHSKERKNKLQNLFSPSMNMLNAHSPDNH